MAAVTATAGARTAGSAVAAAVRARAAGNLSEIELFRDLAGSEPAWRALERDGVLTPYQRYDWAAAWQRNDGAGLGVTPLVAVGYDRKREPLFLWPFGVSAVAGFRIGRFLGGKHANYNFGPWRRDLAFGAVEIAAALRRLHTLAPDLDALELLNQPESWEGMANPWCALTHQPSPSEGFRLPLSASGEEVLARAYSASTRSRLRTKERKLKAIPGYRYARAGTAAEAERYLEAFLRQKAERFAAQGVENAFGRPGTIAFLAEACTQGLDTGTPVIELHALDSDAGVLALFGGVTDGRRFSAMINSITLDEHAKHSPGLILLNHLVAGCAERGMAMFDLGVGEARYKSLLCDETEPLFDSFVPLSARGRLVTLALGTKANAKRLIKHTPALWSLVLWARQKLSRAA